MVKINQHKPVVILDARMISHSGIGIYLQNLIPLLEKKIHLILMGKEEKFRQFPWHKRFQTIPLHADIYTSKEQIEFIYKISKAELFWSPHFNVPILPIRSRYRLTTIHDVFHVSRSNQFPVHKKILARILLYAAKIYSNKIITVSEFSKTEIVKYTRINPKKIHVIYNGIDHNIFNISSPDPLIRKKYQLPEKFILYVGNIKPHKNLKLLIHAFFQICDSFPGLGVVLVGKKSGFQSEDRELYRFLEKHPDLKNKVLFTGFVSNDEVAAMYRLANVFVLPSLYEGFGLPPLEAMACGCPVIVSDIDSLKETCSDAAYYIDPKDVASLSKGLHRVLTMESLRESLINNGMKRAKLFDWHHSCRQHLQIIYDALI